ncbi:MAG: hypothetical protein ACODAQ_09565, partial [Phycisphaeraceae bacterium]
MNRTQSVSTVMFLRVALVVLLATTVCRASQPFVIETDAAHRPAIVLPYDAAAERGFDLEDIRKLKWYSRSPLQRVREAIDYFNEAIEKMTGAPLEMRNDTDLSRGIVLTTLELASPEIREDPRVTEALAQGGENDHGANEAFYMRSASDRLLLVANTPDGLLAGVVALLESVEYEVLGMGPNWVHVPDHRDRPLTFDVERSDRPSFFLRRLWAAGAQSRGVGTINERLPLSDPRDEHVRTSYMRWLIGARLRSKSIPPFPGHAMQQFHGEVLAHMRDTGETQGFLAPAQVGPLAKQPEGSDSLAEDTIYIHTDNANTDEPAQASVWRNGEWREQRAGHVGGVSLDLSVEFVRRIVLEKMRERAEAHFASDTDELFIFGIDPEDGGGYAHFERHMANPQWYARYREQEDDPLGEPYKLHGKFGLDQPVEQWDPSV